MQPSVSSLRSPTHTAPHVAVSLPASWRADLYSLLLQLLDARHVAPLSLPAWLPLLPPADAQAAHWSHLASAAAHARFERALRAKAIMHTQHTWRIEQEEARLSSLKTMLAWSEAEAERQEALVAKDVPPAEPDAAVTHAQEAATAPVVNAPAGTAAPSAAPIASASAAVCDDDAASSDSLFSSSDSSDSLHLGSSSEDDDDASKRKKTAVKAKKGNSARAAERQKRDLQRQKAEATIPVVVPSSAASSAPVAPVPAPQSAPAAASPQRAPGDRATAALASAAALLTPPSPDGSSESDDSADDAFDLQLEQGKRAPRATPPSLANRARPPPSMSTSSTATATPKRHDASAGVLASPRLASASLPISSPVVSPPRSAAAVTARARSPGGVRTTLTFDNEDDQSPQASPVTPPAALSPLSVSRPLHAQLSVSTPIAHTEPLSPLRVSAPLRSPLNAARVRSAAHVSAAPTTPTRSSLSVQTPVPLSPLRPQTPVALADSDAWYEDD